MHGVSVQSRSRRLAWRGHGHWGVDREVTLRVEGTHGVGGGGGEALLRAEGGSR